MIILGDFRSAVITHTQTRREPQRGLKKRYSCGPLWGENFWIFLCKNIPETCYIAKKTLFWW